MKDTEFPHLCGNHPCWMLGQEWLQLSSSSTWKDKNEACTWKTSCSKSNRTGELSQMYEFGLSVNPIQTGRGGDRSCPIHHCLTPRIQKVIYTSVRKSFKDHDATTTTTFFINLLSFSMILWLQFSLSIQSITENRTQFSYVCDRLFVCSYVSIRFHSHKILLEQVTMLNCWLCLIISLMMYRIVLSSVAHITLEMVKRGAGLAVFFFLTLKFTDFFPRIPSFFSFTTMVEGAVFADRKCYRGLYQFAVLLLPVWFHPFPFYRPHLLSSNG